MSKNEFESIEEAIEMLSKGIVDITFVKRTDGNIRTMHSTLHKPYMPFGEYKTVDSVVVNSLSSDGSSPIVVWDLYKSGWRSFYMSTTVEIQESLVFGDTTEMVEEMVQEKVSDYEQPEIDTSGIIENVMDVITGRIEKVKEEAPERIASFTSSILSTMISNVVQSVTRSRRFRG